MPLIFTFTVVKHTDAPATRKPAASPISSLTLLRDRKGYQLFFFHRHMFTKFTLKHVLSVTRKALILLFCEISVNYLEERLIIRA